MRAAALIFLVLLTACSSSPSPSAPSAPSRYQVRASQDADIAGFVDAHATEDIDTLTIVLQKQAASLVPLARLKSLRVLTLSGFKVPEPLRFTDGKPVFDEGLRDIQVLAITKVRSLRRLDLWYARLSEAQRAHLQEALPQCELRENLNKL